MVVSTKDVTMDTRNIWGQDIQEIYDLGTRTLTDIRREYSRARKKFAPMRGPHEGYAVILEELDEMWDAIKANNITDARNEALQVAAMALAFLLEVKE